MPDVRAQDLIAAARAQTGLTRFGDESFREPLEVLVRALQTEARLTPVAEGQQLANLTSQLVTRLRLQAFLERYPEIAEQEIRAPVVIVGPQRTGTSKLFGLIASDPQWNVLHTWQALNPIPLGDERPGGEDPRIAFAEDWVGKMKWLQPGHALDARAPEMEAFLLAATFMLNSPTCIVPSHQRWCETADYRAAYAYLRRMLQFLQWQARSAPGRRWILKSPPHLPNLGALCGIFPGATLVMTHRHPRTNVTSMLRLVELAQQSCAVEVDRLRIRDAWLRILSLGIRRFLEFRDGGGEDRFVDVGYPEVLGEPLGAVTRIYRAAEAPLPADIETIIARWEAAHPQHEKGEFRYDAADYRLTDADIEREFSAYIRRFGAWF